MPRGPRLIFDHACYHIINRGNQKQNIFLENSDFQNYLKIIKHYKRKYGFKLFGYCLMPNHIHLIIEPKRSDELAKIMQGITQVYTLCFNSKHKKTGHLWQGRFKNMIVHMDDYFAKCIYYLETNPVRAGLVDSPADYLWSSFRDRVFGNKSGLLDLPDST